MVKTATQEQVSLSQRLQDLEALLSRVQKGSTPAEKLATLDSTAAVQDYLQQHRSFPLEALTADCQLAAKSVMALEQGDILFAGIEDYSDVLETLRTMLTPLTAVEKFYAPIGGIIGYHVALLRLIAERQEEGGQSPSNSRFYRPEGLDLSRDTFEVRRMILAGIQHMGLLAETYAVGGAGDRLDLRDDITQESLPVACLQFGGRSLLEGLIRDLQAREYLHYKLYGKRLTTPIVMMTSPEKNNDHYIKGICKSRGWFGRSEDAFRFFEQPMVPVMTSAGNWSMTAPLRMKMKPGGHGVIWKLALDNGVFDWLKGLGRTKTLVRQINNPIAGIHNGLTAFLGVGLHSDRAFGFASCPRFVHASEGMDVVMETREWSEGKDAYGYRLTNIEYTDFQRHGVQDVPVEEGSPHSAFPTNTNILFADLDTVAEAAAKNPVPGMLVNMKNKAPDTSGRRVRQLPAGRLESTMQNIADDIVDRYDAPLEKQEWHTKLRAYLTYNHRIKTISVTKQSWQHGKSFVDTPEGTFYDMLQNHRDLLVNYCNIETPALGDASEVLEKTPPFVLHYLPALGPIYSVIAQKVRGGKLAYGAEVQLELSELCWEDVTVDGSLLVQATAPLGLPDAKGIVHYGNDSGKCTLRNVHINNAGIDTKDAMPLWKNAPTRTEALHIVIHGNGEFVAENVTFTGNHLIEVPDNTRVVAVNTDDGLVRFLSEPIVDGPSWFWKYSVDDEANIVLERAASDTSK